ncbi:MAG TPA: GGDEF domain-containing protein [Gammaproteobacteria bacterium]
MKDETLIDFNSMERAVAAEQVKMLVAQSPTGIVMSFLLASFVAMVFGELVPGRFVFIWWLVISASFLVQYILYVAFNRESRGRISFHYWYFLILAASAVSGLCWGLGLTYMLSRIEPQYHIFLIILLISLASAGITLAIRTSVYYAFQVSVLLPVIVWLTLQSDITNAILGIFLLIFMVAMWLFAGQVSRVLSNSFRLQLENQTLANSLKQSNARLQVLNEELTQLSATDSLTQVANRRYFDERFSSEFSRASRENTSLSVLMIDVDFFKPYNDEFGHLIGDESLQQVAMAIRDSLKRPTDLVARYGGEEFIVLLPSTGIEGAVQLAEEIRQKIESLRIAHPHSEVSQYVTVSLGVTGSFPGKSISKEQMLQKADEALYNAKALGRNRVECAHLEPEAAQYKQNL